MTLLGDAAHPMVPHLGQSATQAIEDGFTLPSYWKAPNGNSSEVLKPIKMMDCISARDAMN